MKKKLRDDCGGVFKQEWVEVEVRGLNRKKVKVTVLAMRCQKCRRFTFTINQAKFATRKQISILRKKAAQ